MTDEINPALRLSQAHRIGAYLFFTATRPRRKSGHSGAIDIQGPRTAGNAMTGDRRRRRSPSRHLA
ncbi:hypothetical protein AFE_2904 [Acidithiobacillus ferrooxidans ATCC 23270]|uniref:Uncharacterized protein n=1 Tax=Acidithiobacillus ferrooxidans (strain ATCC 23270 / DSM 14882 / CIP 104768 / NCIMB 8455) TaxID=243159 RepID=B7J995_ACIF2|nr:hypothetical protein AFE_2904 [Acidithiobacillus ferrooxidans ATCC 23270]